MNICCPTFSSAARHIIRLEGKHCKSVERILEVTPQKLRRQQSRDSVRQTGQLSHDLKTRKYPHMPGASRGAATFLS